MVPLRFPGPSGHSWTSEDGKEYHWDWKAPSSPLLTQAVPPSLFVPFFVCSILLPLSADLFSLFVYGFSAPPNFPWLWAWLWPDSSLRILSFRVAPSPPSVCPATHSLHSKFARENLSASDWVSIILVQSAVARSGLWDKLGLELRSVCLLSPLIPLQRC